VIWLGMEDADRLVAFPKAFNMQTMFIESPTTITMAKVIWIVVLECLLAHTAAPLSSYDHHLDVNFNNDDLSCFINTITLFEQSKALWCGC